MLGHQKKVYVPTFILILLFQTYCKHDRGWIRKTISRLRLTEKDHTHVRKVGHTPEFLFGIYWWTLKKLKNLTFEKMKKIAGDIIILHMWTQNHNHTRYSSWDTEWNRMFCHFGPFFALLTSTL